MLFSFVFHSICTIFASIMDIDTLEGLRKCPLFEGFSDNEIIDLMHAIRYRVTRLFKGDFLFVAGEDCIHANILIDGEVVAYLEGASDRYIRMSTFHAGNMFAPAFLFAQECQPFMPATCLRRHSSSHKNVDIPLRYRRRQTRGSCEFYQQILSDCSNLIPV